MLSKATPGGGGGKEKENLGESEEKEINVHNPSSVFVISPILHI